MLVLGKRIKIARSVDTMILSCQRLDLKEEEEEEEEEKAIDFRMWRKVWIDE